MPRRTREWHGMTYSPEWNTWTGIIQRCEDPRTACYHNYGGRGVKICKRWRESFTAFLSDMGKRPSADHQIERINNDGDYEPSNCRWATRYEQSRNRRTNHLITVNGETLTLGDWAKRIGCTSSTIIHRLQQGYSEEEAVSRVLGMGQRKLLTFNGRTLTISQWARETGLKQATLARRIRAGWSIEESLTNPARDWGR